MTWAESADKILDKIANYGDGSDLDNAIATVAIDVTRKLLDSLSLARIATALYKIAGLEDHEDPNKYLEGFFNE